MSLIDHYDGFTNFFPINPGSYNGGLAFLNGGSTFHSLDNETNHLLAYNSCPPLKSIISKRAKAFNVGHIDVYDGTTGEKAKSAYADSIRKLLIKPNVIQTGKQFFAQQNTYLDLFGWCPVYQMKPYGMQNTSSLWNIPPWLLNPNFALQNFWSLDSSTPLFSSFSLTWRNEQITIDTENIKMIFDDGFGTDNNINLTIPDSRLRSLEYPIWNIVAALQASNTGITRKGPSGILSNNAKDTLSSLPIDPTEKKNLQDQWKRYGLTGQEYQVIITEANLSWQQIGSSLRDMNLHQEIAEDINHICDAFGWPPELMAYKTNDAYLNRIHAEKNMYTGTIIPESNSRGEQRTNTLIDPESGLYLFSDFSGEAILQEDKLLTAQVRESQSKAAEKEFKNNVITLNMWLSLIGCDPRTDGYGEKYYYELIALGWQFGNTSLAGGDTMPTTARSTQQPSEPA